MNRRYSHVPVTRVEFEARKCIVCSGSPIPMRFHALYHPHMTMGGIDDESMSCADASTRYIPQIPMGLYYTVCFSAFEHRVRPRELH
ncbi:unnamed protein product [Penicillium nalgiovense]|uniref:Uncharacterized protein n=1 Tax=Penicillium nalgiovense TaxID=60175 RepID=A0A9W4HQ11_PENNA|nr:unnamed protein product [Penicillium nalgiovense]CAG8032275.1 unnamed protein product [Penicillium nalgiovense]CAG8034280.1 unnamed protein product [Penicillium nalgiovense]CAG8058131.1 unnamed protein product [Penicillium nalgiovense]CAG8060715.1 unnamed protein product [Penicillium nalgiovense]